MRVNLIGSGKLGLSYAAFISSRGHSVHCIDSSESMIDSYKSGNFETKEPGVSALASAWPMTYSTTKEPAPECDFSIVLVPTPTTYSGYDHTILESVLDTLTGKVVVTCTVQPGFCDRYGDRLIYNPLFVQIGNILDNLNNTKDVLIGGPDGVLADFYSSLFGQDATIHYMSYLEAEVAKLGLNSFITTKISFANMIGDVLRRSGRPADKTLRFIGSDRRVGSKCLQYGWGYGGPCFPRDNRALSTFLREKGAYDYLPVAAHESNERHAVEQANYFEGDTIKGVCYKDDCEVDIIEESHKIKTAYILRSQGRKFTIVDRQEVLRLLPKDLAGLSAPSACDD